MIDDEEFNHYSRNVVTKFYNKLETVIIPSGGSLSPGIDVSGYSKFSILTPSEWTAADLTFLSSSTLDGTYQSLYDDALIEISAKVSGGVNTSLNVVSLKISPNNYIKIRSGTTATPVNQEAERTLTLICAN